MPVANICVLARELFMGKFDPGGDLCCGAVNDALRRGGGGGRGKLFGQEAVLFADSGSVKTVFQRRHFKPRSVPSAAQVLLVIVLVYSLNFYIQQAITQAA